MVGQAELRFDGVDFAYPNAPQSQVLSGLSFAAQRGETVGIIGPPGSGKSTLAHLPLQRQALPWDAAFLAGQAFKLYRQHSGTDPSPMPHFYIGAHAWVNQLQLLTRDAVRYRRYFPKLTLVVP